MIMPIGREEAMNNEQKFYILDRPDPTKEFLAARQVTLHGLRH